MVLSRHKSDVTPGTHSFVWGGFFEAGDFGVKAISLDRVAATVLLPYSPVPHKCLMVQFTAERLVRGKEESTFPFRRRVRSDNYL
ncbi:hypothetical protein RRG08_019970 [Elysia crispata]|uniref:Uncharacterized protein n=1 Tax=Elysia crispata TaxID=231223 RepID=A0AAE1D4R5_9GAST|nr:hypothetical protein RRG08_019970 [Elysia crispata]